MIFIYCGGKCGGSTLRESLKHLDEVIHIHNNKYYQTEYNDSNISIFDKIDEQKGKTYIIDVYRNELDRKISSFIQNIQYHMGEKWRDKSFYQIFSQFKKDYYELENYEAIDEVFHHYRVLPFKKSDKPYDLKIHNNLVLVKLKFDNIADWGKHLSEIFNKRIKIKPDNLTKNKETFNLYFKLKRYIYNMPKEQAFQTTAQRKEMYLKSVRPVEVLYNQPFKKVKRDDPLPMTKPVLMFKGLGGSI